MSIKASILASYGLLAYEEKQHLLKELIIMTEIKDSKVLSIRSGLSETHLQTNCVHCFSGMISKRGKKAGNQQYQCKECKKYFSNTTGSSLHGIKKLDKFQQYLQCFLKGYSLDKICAEIGISKQTSFDWRHKILSSLKSKEPIKLGMIVECDEMEIAINEKGSKKLRREGRKRGSDFKRNDKKRTTTVQVVTAIDREGNKFGKTVKSKRITGAQLKKAIGKKLTKDCTLISDEHPSYKKLIKIQKGIKLKQINSKQRVDKKDSSINIQKVNHNHSELRKFLEKFNGVSSKYLENYIQWCNYMKYEESAKAYEQWITEIYNYKNGYNTYKAYKENTVLIRL
jgi:transposase-like protein